jgi:hypothetical protein
MRDGDDFGGILELLGERVDDLGLRLERFAEGNLDDLVF